MQTNQTYYITNSSTSVLPDTYHTTPFKQTYNNTIPVKGEIIKIPVFNSSNKKEMANLARNFIMIINDDI